MKTYIEYIVSFCALMCLLFSSAVAFQKVSRTASIGPDRLKIVTYNVHQGFTNEGRIDPDLFARVISNENPDIITLVESETSRFFLGNYNFAYWLSKKFNMYYYCVPVSKKHSYGVAILSKIPLFDSRVTHLESSEDHWILLESMINYQDRRIKLMSVHVGISVEDRFNQLSWILNEKVIKENNPVILMGDFNTEDDEDFSNQKRPRDKHDGWHANNIKMYNSIVEESMQKGIYKKAAIMNFKGMANYNTCLIDTWKAMNPDSADAYTWRDTAIDWGVPKERCEPPKRIDYIFVSDDFKVLESSIVKTGEAFKASDHLPVVSIVSLRK